MEDIEKGKHEEGRTLRGKTLREEDIKRGRHCPCDLYVCPLRVLIYSLFFPCAPCICLLRVYFISVCECPLCVYVYFGYMSPPCVVYVCESLEFSTIYSLYVLVQVHLHICKLGFLPW